MRTHLLVGVSMMHLRHFFRGFKTAGEGPIYELHGGDPFVVWDVRGTRGERAHFGRGVARIAEGELADGGHIRRGVVYQRIDLKPTKVHAGKSARATRAYRSVAQFTGGRRSST